MRTKIGRAALGRLILATLAAGIALASGGVALAQYQEFKLGFSALASQVPNVVGQPLEEEHYGPNGDSLQRTTTGLMVWRKADNWTAFTNGFRTWVNGPLGLQERPNPERFNWEREARVETTEVVDFAPAGVRGPEQEGRCWTESLAVAGEDAWRCMVGNRIYDPCFATSGDAGSVICGASPIVDPYGFRLKLTEPLPHRTPNEATPRPWLVELADGVACGFLTGASTGIEGDRANYGCTDGWAILGDPLPGQVWTAKQARIQVTQEGPTLVDSARVELKTVWR